MTNNQDLFELIIDAAEKALAVICAVLAVVCIVAGFSKPHCFFMAILYGILAVGLAKCIADRKNEKKGRG